MHVLMSATTFVVTSHFAVFSSGLLISSVPAVIVPSPHRFAEKQFDFEKRQTANRWGEGVSMLKALALQRRWLAMLSW